MSNLEDYRFWAIIGSLLLVGVHVLFEVFSKWFSLFFLLIAVIFIWGDESLSYINLREAEENAINWMDYASSRLGKTSISRNFRILEAGLLNKFNVYAVLFSEGALAYFVVFVARTGDVMGYSKLKMGQTARIVDLEDTYKTYLGKLQEAKVIEPVVDGGTEHEKVS